jgi:hypothetical protein
MVLNFFNYYKGLKSIDINNKRIWGIILKYRGSTFFFSFTFSGFNSDFFVVLFKGSKIFSGF